jgi:dTDP-4-dehydrorhamnose 3,5-epimerase
MLKGLITIQSKRLKDERGSFLERYQSARYAALGVDVPFVQDNEVFSLKNVLRGLHYQEKPGQAKLLSVSQGSIWDVAVDIRPDSETFGKWYGIELSEENGVQFFIPTGFAHGYCVLSETARVTYKVSSFYDPQEEKTLRWDDPRFGIDWPIQTPLLSEKDRSAPYLNEVFV